MFDVKETTRTIKRISIEHPELYAAAQTSGEILEMTEFKKDKLNRLLKSLIQKNYINVTGKGRGTRYFKR